jgi:membrane protein DedA with SNARE-associated domain
MTFTIIDLRAFETQIDNGPLMDPLRLATTLYDSAMAMSSGAAYASIIGVLLLCGLGLPIPEDITLLAAGLLASSKHISLPGALVAGFIGVLIGDAILFTAGRKFGARIFGLPGFRRFLTPERIAKAEDRIRKNGHFICFVARFLPGLRAPIYALAGAMGVRPAVFIMQDGFAALISVPIWVYLGFLFGENWEDAIKYVKRTQGAIVGTVLVVILLYVAYRFYKRGRAVSTPKA